jgi:DNA polymerase-4
MEVALKGYGLLETNYRWNTPIRALTIRAINLIPRTIPQQLDLFDDAVRREKRDKIETAVEEIRRRFGNRAILAASLMGDIKMPGKGVHEVVMPGLMYQ